VVKAAELIPPAVKDGIAGGASPFPILTKFSSGAEPEEGKDGRKEELAPWGEPAGLVRVESVPAPTAPPRAKSESEDMTGGNDKWELARQKLTTSKE
jgi:hypothetical protein